MGYRLGSMFFLAMLVAVRIMPLSAAEATINATAAWLGTRTFFSGAREASPLRGGLQWHHAG